MFGQSSDTATVDLEQNAKDAAHLRNTKVRSFSWQDVTVTVKDHKTKQPKQLLQNVSGRVGAGELLAIMGPSGSGKTTLLNVLAHRPASSGAKVEGRILVDGATPGSRVFRRLTSYVEQEDALIGSLTVRETMYFAARLSLPSTVSASERTRRIDTLLDDFGLHEQAHTLIGTPIRKGISGGQKRRLSVASQLITSPKILFLDEPTSGLDSASSFEVMSYIRGVAREHNLLVIASIHQPSSSTFSLFTSLLLLSAGKTCYFGPVPSLPTYFSSPPLNLPIPAQVNPAEWVLEMTNVDFARGRGGALERLERIQGAWRESGEARRLGEACAGDAAQGGERGGQMGEEVEGANKFAVPFTLLHRGFIKSYRDVVAYGIRIAMYVALAIMMGTVWLRLDASQESIQPFINAIFFGSAFMSFMAVAYVPAYLEDYATYIKEEANGLYGATSFMLANFLIGIPYLFIISLLFSTLSYWLANFRSTALGYVTYTLWLFIDLLAAESLVVLISSLFPNFVLALSLTAFANGLWMCVGGFLVSPKLLNVFWRYVAHYIDYQSYVFQGMMVNEFGWRTYSCARVPVSDQAPRGCACAFLTDLAPECRIRGQGVLDAYGYHRGKTGEWVGILAGIILGYRVLGWLVLWARRSRVGGSGGAGSAPASGAVSSGASVRSQRSGFRAPETMEAPSVVKVQPRAWDGPAGR